MSASMGIVVIADLVLAGCVEGALRRDRNHSSDRRSSRSLPLNLSSAPFCQGLPGSLKAVAMPDWATHSRMAY